MLKLPASAQMTLDHLLAALDVGVTHFTVCDIRSGWGMRLDACKAASLHYCLEGVGTLAVDGSLPVQLEPHTFVLLPPGVAYRIESASPESARLEYRASLCGASSQESVPKLIVGEGRKGIITVCGEIRVGFAGGSDLFVPLGEPLVVRFGGADGLREQFVMLLAESTRPGVGSRVLTEALLKQCLVLALRRWIELDARHYPGWPGWLTRD